MASKCHLSAVYVISQSKERGICTSAYGVIAQNRKQAHMQKILAKGEICRRYNDDNDV